MPLLNAGGFVDTLKTSRLLTFKGRTGGGKTSLAYYLAYLLHEQKFVRYIFSNVESVWNDDPEDMVMVDRRIDAAFILDEGGLFLENRKDFKQYSAFMRKLNIVLLIPSVWEPMTGIKFLTVQRLITLDVVGLPVWVYQWRLSHGDIREKGIFFWRRPSEVWGIYDTAGFPTDDDGISDYISKWTEEAKRQAGYARRRKGFRDDDTDDHPDDTAKLILDAVEEFGWVAERHAEEAQRLEEALSVHDRKSRKGRR